MSNIRKIQDNLNDFHCTFLKLDTSVTNVDTFHVTVMKLGKVKFIVNTRAKTDIWINDNSRCGHRILGHRILAHVDIGYLDIGY